MYLNDERSKHSPWNEILHDHTVIGSATKMTKTHSPFR
jgi:hypothetical protein